ncbi:RadC family protein [Budvicia diplopodorum]|uniref:RadC family protein n=1 Tax=Budvicia diplopodorum TaxID=1119056 RepID=UPI00135A18E3|nr:DNA repair protein RadC [Budvicia diplopodorum]
MTKAKKHIWSKGHGPREKLLALGAITLSDQELLAIFLRTGLPGLHVSEMAAQLLVEFGSLYALISADYTHFCEQPGLGLSKYTQLQAAVELSRRFLGHQIAKESSIRNPKKTQEYLQGLLSQRDREVFIVMFLDNQNRVLYHKEMFTGTFNCVEVHPREIVREALKSNAASVILAHNHPSGVAEPSQADRSVTDQVLKACSVLDIKVLDHIVIGCGECVSFAERGWI